MFVLFLFSLCFNACHFLQLENHSIGHVQDCVQRTMKKVFGLDDTILFINFGGENVFPDVITNPYVSLNYSQTKKAVNTGKVIGNWINTVVHVRDYPVDETIDIALIKPFLINHAKHPGRRVSIFIAFVIDTNDVSSIFEEIWSSGVVNVTLISYDGNNNIKVHYSNPTTPENKCGRQCKKFVSTDCNSTFTYNFSKSLSKYSSCVINFYVPEHSVLVDTIKMVNTAVFVLTKLTKMTNMTLHVHPNANSIHLAFFSIATYMVGSCEMCIQAYTNPFARHQIIWIVPDPQKLSSMQVLRNVFKPVVWFLIFMAFVITSLTWWLITKYYREKETSCIVLQVFSITLFGISSRIPRKRVICVIFIIYIVYSVHIQTGFTSNLVRLLTVPQYDKQIQSVRELIDSDIPVLVDTNHYLWFRKLIKTSEELKEKYKNVTLFEITDMIQHQKIIN